MFFISEGTHLYKFLMILACVGEYPMKAVHLLGYERVWKQKINEWHKYQIYCLPGTNEKVRAQLLGRPLPHQLANQTQAHPLAIAYK